MYTILNTHSCHGNRRSKVKSEIKSAAVANFQFLYKLLPDVLARITKHPKHYHYHTIYIYTKHLCTTIYVYATVLRVCVFEKSKV